MNKKLKITLDTNIVIDYLNKSRPKHNNALRVFSSTNVELYISGTVIKEVNDKSQQLEIQNLIRQKKLYLLPEPQVGIRIPAIIPASFTDISPIRDNAHEQLMRKRNVTNKTKFLRDHLIAEAHKLSGNDLLLTGNTKDFLENSDIKVVDYQDVFSSYKV